MTPDHPHHTSQGPTRSRFHRLEGAALVIVLSCLVLVTALIIGFLSRAQTERGNSASYRGGMGSRNLSDYAVNVVMAQIRAATTGTNAANAWASQPGAIRVYASNAATLVNIYKLYSSTNMVASNASATNIVTADVAALASWSNNTALYTDLNAPVVTGSGTALRTNYPILDPGALGVVQGFTNVIVTGVNSATNPVPMPVTWLYVLEDGTLVAPTGSGNTATVAGATSNNPITGRIAFWTDDDTCKININTASGAPWNFSSGAVTTTYVRTVTAPDPANFWDVPVMGSVQDANLALSQPWKGEYQRYPGHPATISLSAALPSLTSRSAIEDLTPRVNSGGSSGGSVVNITPTALADDGARLYANVDELLFATNRSATGTNPLSATDIERARFFLTASSRAPDVTLFNTPRLLCWPITFTSGNTTKMTPYDQLIAFCGTVGSNTNIGGPNSYYFTRSDPFSATVDYNANTRLLGYLQRMTETPVPGFGGSGILSKYTTANEPAQIRTEIFDYIRCLNSQDTSVTTNNTYWYTPTASNAWIVPSAPVNGTRGFGRFPTVSKAALMFWGNSFITTNTVSGGVTNTTTNGINLNAALLLENFTPALGWPGIAVQIRIQVTGLNTNNNLRWGTNGIPTSPIFHANSTNTTVFTWAKRGERPYGGRQGFRMLMNTSFPNSYPLLSTNVLSANYTNTNTLDGNFALGNGTITVQVGIASGGSTNYFQTVQIFFPDATNIALPKTTNLSVSLRDSAVTNDSTLFAVVTTNDVVRGVSVRHGDFRLTAARTNVSSSSFTNLPSYATSTNLSHRLVASSSGHQFSGVTTNSYFSATNPAVLAAATALPSPMDAGIDASTATALLRGDWDNGTGVAIDGPYINWADEGNAYYTTTVGNPAYPYFTGEQQAQAVGPSLFTPNRLMPSAGMFGSLPTGVIADVPWQTLLFRPAALTVATHPGLNNPPDYLLLDLFNMPVVEPYAITEPLSTAGRVNMNYQILPFTYIKRNTAVQAALHTERMTVLTTNAPASYGMTSKFLGTNVPINVTNRPTLNLSTTNGTLVGFEQRFGSNDIFRSAAEICSIPLVPANSTWSSVTNTNSTGFWATNSATGDNSKERPYARIYPKLTTKSNTYTVHYRVEVLKKRPNSPPATWTEGQDKVLSTYRGSTTIERYVNPRDAGLPDYASGALPPVDPLPNFYKFRVVGERQFNP
jgi:uncharacterized protein (TIGR02600 family)